jgi:hypothetical protein
LSAEEERLVAEHLAACPSCRDLLSELTRSASLARGLKDVEPPAWLKARIMEQVIAEARTGQRQSLLRKLFLPLSIKIPLEALATVVVAAFAFYLYHATAPELYTPGAPNATVQESVAAPMAEAVTACQTALSEAQQPPQPMAKAPVPARKSISLNHLQSGHQHSEEEHAPPALQETTQVLQQPVAPAPAAGAPIENKAKDAYLSKQEEQALSDNISRAQAPMIGMSARKASPLKAETAALPPAITLEVADIRQTIIALEKIVNALNGRSAVLEQTGTMAMLRITIIPDQIPTLMTRLAELGGVSRDRTAPQAGTDTVVIRLEQRKP